MFCYEKGATETLDVLDVSHTKVRPFTEDVTGSYLSTLRASNCSLTGKHHFLIHNSLLVFVITYHIIHCYLNPTDIDGFYSLGGLEILTLSDNHFEERLSTKIGNLDSLLGLSCSNCGLYGLIPTEIGNLEAIQELDLGKNALSGPLPLEFGNLENLQKLILRENGLSGEMISFEDAE